MNTYSNFSSDFRFLRVACSSPKIQLASPLDNARIIIDILDQANKNNVGLLIFPQLTLTGVSCGDLFFQPTLYQGQEQALELVLSKTKDISTTVILGAYRITGAGLVNKAIVCHGGEILEEFHITPSQHQSQWFNTGARFPSTFDNGTLSIGFVGNKSSEPAPFEAHPTIVVSMNDLPHLSGRGKELETLAISESSKNICAYISISPGAGESTSDQVFGGYSIISENGTVLAQGSSFDHSNAMVVTEIDCGKLAYKRNLNSSHKDLDMFGEANPSNSIDFLQTPPLIRSYSPTPFLEGVDDMQCKEIFDIQCHALARRLDFTKSQKTVIGISGGLDSTLALLVCHGAFKLLNKKPSDIIAVTMPGFGTSDQTYDNALSLMQALSVSRREISIAPSVKLHFQDIGHDLTCHDLTYQNAQARERTQILMDIASMESGFVVGTGDLSESALGWCTYNGDHMSMYNVNGGISKTLVAHIVSWYGRACSDNHLSTTLDLILDTPISPELLPPSESGSISQKTEDQVGPYILHDFFIYHTLDGGMPPKKLYAIATMTFEKLYSPSVILKWLKVFYGRFFSQQFKRNCSVEGPQVNGFSLSPRGGLAMPSDASAKLWLAELETL